MILGRINEITSPGFETNISILLNRHSKEPCASSGRHI